MSSNATGRLASLSNRTLPPSARGWSDLDRVERRHRDPGEDQRTPFEKDRDRLLYSSAFQRLAGITQIVRAGEADIFHTRQQHTIKVAQVGRRLGQLLQKKQPELAAAHGLDPEVVEAACLAHDLGHPPIGHIGEKTLDRLVREKGDTDGFEGNAQSFRVVTKLAVRFPDSPGIDLTRATLAAMLKYPWLRANTGPKSKKWSAYRSERADFEFAREFHSGDLKTLEAELMDWADDVAYSVHDLEDFHRCNVIPWRKIFASPDAVIAGAMKSRGTTAKEQKQRLNDALERLRKHLFGNFGALLQEAYEGRADQREQLRRMTSQLIGRYIHSIDMAPLASGKRPVTFDEDALDEVTVLKQITRDYVIGNPSLMAQQEGQKRIIRQLYTAIFDGIDDKTDYPPFLPVRLRYLKEISDNQSARFVADCVATLSEKEAIGLHGRLFGSATGSVLDPIVR